MNSQLSTLHFHRETGRIFGRRVEHLPEIKAAVGERVVCDILWREDFPHTPIFLSDGTSSSYVWAAYQKKFLRTFNPERKNEKIKAVTNNVDVALQWSFAANSPNCPSHCGTGALEGIDVTLVPGAFHPDYCATLCETTKEWITANSHSCTACVLSASVLDAQHGPYGKHTCSNDIKEIVMRNAKVLIVVVTHEKLQRTVDWGMAANPELWSQWTQDKTKKKNLYVVTSLSGPTRPELDDRFSIQLTNAHPRSPIAIEYRNYYRLKELLGNNLIIARPARVKPREPALA